jgi:2-polyprenyl-6-methoxyphenol hydroxylase-like FAD-dependent oxidoreductase
MTQVSSGTAILGAGAAGLAAALALSGRSRVRIIAPTVPTATEAARVDMVPAAFLAFLLELGVHPSQIGARDLHDVRYIAWTGATPETMHGSAMAHIERPALELALLAAVERRSDIRILASSSSHLTDPEERLIDATGRRAFSTQQIVGLAAPWIAHVFSLRGVFEKADQAFRMAALPAGYVYRLASPRLLSVGVVLSKATGRLTAQDIERYIRSAGAGWVIEDLRPLHSIQTGRGGIASVQWSSGVSPMLRVGDAVLGRDSLSAQGLCSGLSDAALLVRETSRSDQCANRQRAQLMRHLRYLATAIDRSRFRAENAWSDYRQFLTRIFADNGDVTVSPARR